MKIFKIYILIFIILFLTGCGNSIEEHSGLSNESSNMNSNLTKENVSSNIYYNSGIFANKNWNDLEGTYMVDAVPDQKTAEKIAQAIFDAIEQESPQKNYVLKYVFYDEEDEIWIVSFGEDRGVTYDDSTLNIAFQKEDGKVLRIWFQ